MKKFMAARPFANPDVAARRLIEIANGVQAVQDGRIYIELINAQFLKAGGTSDPFRVALDRPIGKGWLWRRESGTGRPRQATVTALQ